MNEREYKVKLAESALKNAEAEKVEAALNLEHGERMAKAQYERELAKLNTQLKKAQIEIERSKAWLDSCIAEQERGFC